MKTFEPIAAPAPTAKSSNPILFPKLTLLVSPATAPPWTPRVVGVTSPVNDTSVSRALQKVSFDSRRVFGWPSRCRLLDERKYDNRYNCSNSFRIDATSAGAPCGHLDRGQRRSGPYYPWPQCDLEDPSLLSDGALRPRRGSFSSARDSPELESASSGPESSPRHGLHPPRMYPRLPGSTGYSGNMGFVRWSIFIRTTIRRSTGATERLCGRLKGAVPCKPSRACGTTNPSMGRVWPSTSKQLGQLRHGRWGSRQTFSVSTCSTSRTPVFNRAAPCSLPCPLFEEGQLAHFYRGMITTIHKIDPNTLIFYEPIPELTGSSTSLPAPLTNDPNLGFTFHYYDRACGTLPEPASPPGAAQQDLRCATAESAALDTGIAYASRAGVAVDFGEFGDSTNATDDANMVDLAGQRFLNWTYWEYYTTPSSLAPGLLIDDKKPGSEANADQQILNALVAPYPEAVTGTPESYSLDRSTWTMTFTYSTTPVQKGLSCPNPPTEIFVPHRDYPHGYSVEVSGAKVVSPPTWPWVELVSHDQHTQVTVTIRPAADSSTQVPTSAIDPRSSTFGCR